MPARADLEGGAPVRPPPPKIVQNAIFYYDIV